MSTGALIPLRRVSGDITEQSDAALLAASATGDAASFGALFDRHHQAVYRFAARLAVTDDAARDDLVQATFLEVRRIAGKFRGQSSVRTWILGVAANVARHQWRGEQRRRARQARYAEGLDAAAPGGAEDAVDRHRLLARLGDAVATLPHDQQVAFVLCDLEQLPGAEVAKALGVPEGTLWRRLHDARKRLRAALGGAP